MTVRAAEELSTSILQVRWRTPRPEGLGAISSKARVTVTTRFFPKIGTWEVVTTCVSRA
jgi:hypothetical protein